MSSRNKKNRSGGAARPTDSERQRNRPCPCGSGLAYKNCCARKDRDEGDPPGSRWGKRKSFIAALLVLCVLAGGIHLAVLRPWSGPEATPDPWEYDAAEDRHWHPMHEHWHDGPPPPPFGETPARPSEPVPWEYDEAGNRYWHPGHRHWHFGRPPPPEDR